MPLNNAAMVIAANAIIAAYPYGQLHSGAAGSLGTANLTTAARQAIPWATPTGAGTIALTSAITYTGGAAGAPVFSLTLWSLASGGAFGGEFPLTGDAIFDPSGNYIVTALDLVGAVS